MSLLKLWYSNAKFHDVEILYSAFLNMGNMLCYHALMKGNCQLLYYSYTRRSSSIIEYYNSCRKVSVISFGFFKKLNTLSIHYSFLPHMVFEVAQSRVNLCPYPPPPLQKCKLYQLHSEKRGNQGAGLFFFFLQKIYLLMTGSLER